MTVVLVSVIFLIGFDSLINSAILFTNVFRSDNTEQSKTLEDSFYGSVDLDTPPVATNTATIIVTGQATGFDSVDYYLNNIKSASITVGKQSSFTEEIGKLKVGENQVYAVARTKNGKNSKKTEKFTVEYKRDPPSLQIDQPRNDAVVNAQEIQLSGNTDRNTSLYLNNSPIVVDLTGEFESTFRLKEGDNILQFKAVDIAGNTTEKSVQIRYERDD